MRAQYIPFLRGSKIHPNFVSKNKKKTFEKNTYKYICARKLGTGNGTKECHSLPRLMLIQFSAYTRTISTSRYRNIMLIGFCLWSSWSFVRRLTSVTCRAYYNYLLLSNFINSFLNVIVFFSKNAK